MQIRVIIVVLKGSQVVCGQRFHQALGSQLVTAFVYLPLNNAQGELALCKVKAPKPAKTETVAGTVPTKCCHPPTFLCAWGP